MSHPRWVRLLLATLVLQLSTLDPLWAQGELSFTRQDYEVGSAQLGVTVGDFNSDGRQDVATADLVANTVSILLNEGDGTFQAAFDVPAGQRPHSVIVGDFNGDSRQDLATANAGTCTGFPCRPLGVTVFLGNGDGTFESARDFETGGDPSSVTVGDFNGDSQQDLVTSNVNGDSVSILLGNGDGTFAPAQEFEVGEFPSTFGHAPSSVTVGDFNGDSQQDLATSNVNSETVSLLLGNGDGTFEPPQDTVLLDSPQAVIAGDFNGDGRPDLAASKPVADTISILLGNGDGTFQPAQDVVLEDCPAFQRFPGPMTLGDFNGDSQQDLATISISTDTVSLLLGNGDGTFEFAQHFAVGPSPRSLTVGDFNNDGAQDVAVAAAGMIVPFVQSVVTILTNDGSAVPPPLTSSPPPALSPIASDNSGGGAVDRVSLLLLVIVLSASAACVRRRQRALAARRFD